MQVSVETTGALERRIEVSVPRERIANVMLFGRPAAQPGAIYVSRLWLE